MVWFKSEIDYAKDSLTQASDSAIERAGEQLSEVVASGIARASGELRDVVMGASTEVDAKLDKISQALHDQRSFTKSDVKELVDYAADRLGDALDARVRTMRAEIADLVEEKVEYFKQEVDTFFVRRQEDLARERRRLLTNVGIALTASLGMAIVSLTYHDMARSHLDLFTVFRIVLAAAVGGSVAWLAVRFVQRYRRLSEPKKDLVYMTMRHWGVLHPANLWGYAALFVAMALIAALVLFPAQLAALSGNAALMRWAHLIGR